MAARGAISGSGAGMDTPNTGRGVTGVSSRAIGAGTGWVSAGMAVGIAAGARGEVGFAVARFFATDAARDGGTARRAPEPRRRAPELRRRVPEPRASRSGA